MQASLCPKGLGKLQPLAVLIVTVIVATIKVIAEEPRKEIKKKEWKAGRQEAVSIH